MVPTGNLPCLTMLHSTPAELLCWMEMISTRSQSSPIQEFSSLSSPPVISPWSPSAPAPSMSPRTSSSGTAGQEARREHSNQRILQCGQSSSGAQMTKYFARMTQDQDSTLSVYETPSFGLLDKKSIKVEGLKGFSWSPKDTILAY